MYVPSLYSMAGRTFKIGWKSPNQDIFGTDMARSKNGNPSKDPPVLWYLHMPFSCSGLKDAKTQVQKFIALRQWLEDLKVFVSLTPEKSFNITNQLILYLYQHYSFVAPIPKL